MIGAVVAAGLVGALGATGESSRVSASADVYAGVDTGGAPPGTRNPTVPDVSGWRAGGGLFAVGYLLAPRVDNEPPPSLHPFLQRLSTFSVSCSARHIDDTSRATSFPISQRMISTTEGCSLDADVYASRYVALGASAGFFHDESTSTIGSTSTGLPGLSLADQSGVDLGVHVALRIEDVRVALSYHTPDILLGNGTGYDPGVHTVALDVRAVIDRRFDLTGGIRNVRDGAALYAGLTGYASRRLGIGGSLAFQGRSTNYGQPVFEPALYASVEYWLDPKSSLGLTYGGVLYAYQAVDTLIAARNLVVQYLQLRYFARF